MAHYKIIFYDDAGIKLHECADYASIGISVAVNEVGVMTFSVLYTSPSARHISMLRRIEVYRRDKAHGGSWLREFRGKIKEFSISYNDGSHLVTVYAENHLAELATRINAYYTEHEYASQFKNRTPAEILTAVVQNNFISQRSDRITKNSSNHGISSVKIVGANLTTISEYPCAYDNVLKIVQDICTNCGGDFDISDAGEFSYFYPFMGSDLRETVKFSVGLKNMANPVIKYSAMTEKNTIIAVGQGVSDTRHTVVSYGPFYNSTSDSEMFVNANEASSHAGVQFLSSLAAIQNARTVTLKFNVVQTGSTTYGIHYRLGDIVTAEYLGTALAYKVKKVLFTVDSDGNDNLAVELETVVYA